MKYTLLIVFIFLTGCVSNKKVIYNQNYKYKNYPKQQKIKKSKPLLLNVKIYGKIDKIVFPKIEVWKKKKYNFPIKKRDIKKINKKFGSYYDQIYKTTYFNNGLTINLKNKHKTQIIIPFKATNITKINNWDGDRLLIEGNTVLLIVQGKKIRKLNNKWFLLSEKSKVSVFNKRTKKVININTFFKNI